MGFGIPARTLFVFSIPLWIIFCIIKYVKYKKRGILIPYKGEVFKSIFFLYLLCIAAITVFPFYYIRGFYIIPKINIIPVVNTLNAISNTASNPSNFIIKFWIRNIFGNVVLLMPLAVFLPLLCKRFRNIKSTVIFCFLISLLIELYQYISSYWGNVRSVDIDDLILNTLGAFLGYILYDKFLRKSVLKNYQ